MNAIVNVGGLALTALSLDVLSGQAEDLDKQIIFSILNGNAANGGGNVPHLAVWDEDGNRIGQYKGNADAHLVLGDSKTFTIDPSQNGDQQARPEYLLVSMEEIDAVCILVITVSGNAVQWIWTGDMGYTCGVQWYPSTVSYGSSNKLVKCVWLDKGHTNGARAESLSLHLPSFSADQWLVNQFSKNDAWLCRVVQRMTF